MGVSKIDEVFVAISAPRKSSLATESWVLAWVILVPAMTNGGRESGTVKSGMSWAMMIPSGRIDSALVMGSVPA